MGVAVVTAVVLVLRIVPSLYIRGMFSAQCFMLPLGVACCGCFWECNKCDHATRPCVLCPNCFFGKCVLG